MKKFANKIIIIFIIIVIPVLLINSKVYIRHKLVSHNDELSLPMNGGWEYRWDNDRLSKKISLPVVLKDGKADTTLWISNILPQQKFDHAALFIRTSQQYMKIYIDGELIYSYGDTANGINSYLPGSSWHFIKLPQFYEGKKVKISLTSPYKQYSGHINRIYIGSESSLVLNVIFKYGVFLIVSSIILLFGIILVILYCVLKSEEGRIKSLLYLGIFSLLSGIWITSESKIIQFILDSPVLIFYIACISLFLLPIPLLLFIISTYRPRKSSWLTGFIWIFSSFFVVVTILQIFDQRVFIHSVLINHLLILAFIITLIYISLSEIWTGNKDIRQFFIGCIILCIFAIKDMFNFYFSNIPGLNAQGFLQFGILIFILLLSSSLGHYILEIINEQTNNRIYKSLAYTDMLTGLKNRNSFEEMAEEINDTLEMKNDISIAIFDLNDLKQVNDTLGHQEGDRLICKASAILNDCFGGIGEVFRIGGDEFAVIVTEYSEPVVKKRLLTFEKKLREQNHEEGHAVISIAYGIASYLRGEDKNLHTILVRADEAMYENKAMQKQSSGPASI